MSVPTVPDRSPAAGRVLPIDRLRAFLTALVVTHHAVLAYHPYAPKPPAALTPGEMAWGAFPIVDAARAPGVDLLVALNDSFFMALMFLLAGLFAPSGIARHGGGSYFRERLLRLGLPFLVGAGLLAPLAYSATYAQITAAPSFGGFVTQWLALGVWPAGPAWFLWVLTAFTAVAVLLDRIATGWTTTLARGLFGDGRRPWRALVGFVGASALVYLPATLLVDAMHWSSFGPFFVQTARVPLYLLYFLAGAALASQGLSRGLLDPEGPLARRWLLWGNLAPLPFFAMIAVFLVLLSVLQKGGDITVLGLACSFLFVLSSASTSFALLAYFVRRSRTPNRIWESLSVNAFGIYLVHYPIVAWLQYALLPAALSGWAKVGIVVVGGLTSSWLATAALRRIPAVERVIGRGTRAVGATEAATASSASNAVAITQPATV